MADAELKALVADVKLEFARNREESARIREEFNKNREEFDKNREFQARAFKWMDEESERNRGVVERADETMRALIAEHRRESRAFMTAIVEELKDLRDESQAQRKALLKLIDRLPPPPDDPSKN